MSSEARDQLLRAKRLSRVWKFLVLFNKSGNNVIFTEGYIYTVVAKFLSSLGDVVSVELLYK